VPFAPAKLFADAHEWNKSGVDVDMDLYNNAQGRIIGENNSGLSDSVIAGVVVQAVVDGLLKYINANGQLVYTNQ
jgi:hypothetical protein